MNSPAPLVALLLLGGAGTRLWPLSTEGRPKQFLKLFGPRSLFQMTVERLRLARCDAVVLVTNAALRPHVEADLAELEPVRPHLVLEPTRRDSGPAIAAGVAFVRQRWGRDAVVAALPSDHIVKTDAQFAGSLSAAAAIAGAGHLVTFGIRPTFAATAYGYIERGAAMGGCAGAFAVNRFHEKPDQGTAEAYVRAGTFDWNSGMFVFSAAAFEREALLHMPDIWDCAQRAVAAGAAAEGALTLDPAAFGGARKTSIDYALFEKSRRVVMLPANFAWSDVGDWASVYDVLDKDARGNVVIGEVAMQDCSGTLALTRDVPLALSGLSDMIAVATKDGSFVAPRARAADVKKLIAG